MHWGSFLPSIWQPRIRVSLWWKEKSSLSFPTIPMRRSSDIFHPITQCHPELSAVFWELAILCGDAQFLNMESGWHENNDVARWRIRCTFEKGKDHSLQTFFVGLNSSYNTFICLAESFSRVTFPQECCLAKGTFLFATFLWEYDVFNKIPWQIILCLGKAKLWQLRGRVRCKQRCRNVQKILSIFGGDYKSFFSPLLFPSENVFLLDKEAWT